MLREEELNLGGLKIYQDDELYCFTSDAILLSRFARVKSGDVVADFCSGSGIVGLHLFGLNPNLIKSVTYFEMQKPMFDMSLKTIQANNLADKFFAHNIKVQDIPISFNEKFSLIVCNPPYMKRQAGQSSENSLIAVCKTEEKLTLSELITAISRCLKFGGRTCIVHRADRLCEIISEMQKRNIEPKRLQIVCAKNKAPYLIMIEGVKGGKSGIEILPPIQN